jgi:hypothetical protein
MFILDEQGVEQPAWLHEDGTKVSYWDAFSMLLIEDEEGIRQISHSLAIDLGYEF